MALIRNIDSPSSLQNCSVSIILRHPNFTNISTYLIAHCIVYSVWIAMLTLTEPNFPAGVIEV